MPRAATGRSLELSTGRELHSRLPSGGQLAPPPPLPRTAPPPPSLPPGRTQCLPLPLPARESSPEGGRGRGRGSGERG
eukprot:4014126-Prymnesium_polylepis.2